MFQRHGTKFEEIIRAAFGKRGRKVFSLQVPGSPSALIRTRPEFAQGRDTINNIITEICLTTGSLYISGLFDTFTDMHYEYATETLTPAGRAKIAATLNLDIERRRRSHYLDFLGSGTRPRLVLWFTSCQGLRDHSRRPRQGLRDHSRRPRQGLRDYSRRPRPSLKNTFC